MCRLLYVRSITPFKIEPYLERFALIAKNSPEYQGHGWGLAMRSAGRWIVEHQIDPIWMREPRDYGETNCLIAHARSAFRDEGISVENNMPFVSGDRVFVFNGELHGVRIREQGRIGAEKIFNFLQARHQGDWMTTIGEGTRAIRSRTKRVRAMNFIVADGDQAFGYSCFDEKPEYFTLNSLSGPEQVVCSDKLTEDPGWKPVGTDSAFSISG